MIKPNKTSFWVIQMIKQIIPLVLFFVISIVFFGLTSTDSSQSIMFATFIIIGILLCLFIPFFIIENYFRYKKESYLIDEKQITLITGAILADSKTSLPIKNITFVDLVLPFVEYNLFHTGSIKITSAGAGIEQSVVTMRHLKNYQEIHSEILKQMKANGFSIKNESLKLKAKPDTIGILLNIIRKTLPGIITLLIMLSVIGTGLFAISKSAAIPILLVLVFIFITVLSIIIRYLDLKKREYLVYEDSVNYKKGFLTKHSSFIPVENLSDSTSNQSFLQRIFNVFDIEISSKGIATEIKFKNLTQGPEIESAIDSIISNYQHENIKVESKIINREEREWQPSSFTSSLKMNKLSTVIQALFTFILGTLFFVGLSGVITILEAGESFDGLFYFFLIWTSLAIGLIQQFINIFATTFRVTENNIVEDYVFFSKRKKEFNIKKITAFIITRTILDRLLNTCSIKFLSIGSGYDITFKTINYDEAFITELKKKFSFNDTEQPIDTLRSNFTFTKMIFDNIVLFIFYFILLVITGVIYVLIYFSLTQKNYSVPENLLPLFLFIAIGLTAFVFVIFLIKALYNSFYHPKTRLNLFKDRLVLKKGLLTESESYTRYENIKNLSAIKWPKVNSGKIIVTAAGDQIIQQNNNNNQQNQNTNANYQSGIAFPNKFILEYCDNPHQILDLIEEFIQGKITSVGYDRGKELAKTSHENIISTKSAYANDLSLMIFFGLFLWVIIPFIPLLVIELNNRKYIIQNNRVISFRGIINITKTSILYSKIDNINIQQIFLNKIFKNSTITLETAGSLRPEMFLYNLKDAESVHKTIQEKIKVY